MSVVPGSLPRDPEGGRKTPVLLIAVCAILVLLIAGCLAMCAYGFFELDRPDHWKPGPNRYHATCRAGDCVRLGPIGAPDAQGSAKPVATLAYDPKIDDRIAQWSDCLQSVSTCIYARKGPPEAVLPPCVQASQCPAACKERFSAASVGLTGKPLVKTYLTIFSDKGGYCTPHGGPR